MIFLHNSQLTISIAVSAAQIQALSRVSCQAYVVAVLLRLRGVASVCRNFSRAQSVLRLRPPSWRLTTFTFAAKRNAYTFRGISQHFVCILMHIVQVWRAEVHASRLIRVAKKHCRASPAAAQRPRSSQFCLNATCLKQTKVYTVPIKCKANVLDAHFTFSDSILRSARSVVGGSVFRKTVRNDDQIF